MNKKEKSVDKIHEEMVSIFFSHTLFIPLDIRMPKTVQSIPESLSQGINQELPQAFPVPLWV